MFLKSYVVVLINNNNFLKLTYPTRSDDRVFKDTTAELTAQFH